jgi:uroporphyrinogen-III synthase
MHILLTRPEPDAAQMKAQLEALGHTVSLEPLLVIEPAAIEPRILEGAQALIVTSRNGLRALQAGNLLASVRSLPVFTVGPGTADLARELGFQRVIAGDGAARDLVPLIEAEADPGKGPLVHAAGESVAFDIAAALSAAGFKVETLTVYRAVAADELSRPTHTLFSQRAIDAVILMSPRSADTFAQLVADAGIEADARRPVFLCLSDAVADALHRLAPERIEVAEAPNATAMLAAVGRVASSRRGV